MNAASAAHPMPTIATQPTAALQHVHAKWPERCSQPRCTSHRPLRQPTAHNAPPQNTTDTQPTAALTHVLRSDLNTAASSAAPAIARYGSRLLPTPHPRATAA